MELRVQCGFDLQVCERMIRSNYGKYPLVFVSCGLFAFVLLNCFHFLSVCFKSLSCDMCASFRCDLWFQMQMSRIDLKSIASALFSRRCSSILFVDGRDVAIRGSRTSWSPNEHWRRIILVACDTLKIGLFPSSSDMTLNSNRRSRKTCRRVILKRFFFAHTNIYEVSSSNIEDEHEWLFDKVHDDSRHRTYPCLTSS